MDPKLLKGLMDTMTNPEDIQFYFKGLLYGEPGARKTTTAASFGNSVLFVAADPMGWVSLKNHPELGLGTRIKLMKYAGISQLETLAMAFEEDLELVRGFDTVILDTFSNIASADLTVVQREKIKKKGGPENFDFEKDMWPVYNQNSMRVKAALNRLLNAPVHVIATAHCKEYELKEFGSGTGVIQKKPKFSPEIFSEVNAAFSMIAYMAADTQVDRAGNISYKITTQFHPTDTIMAKTRIGGLPVTQINANFKEIVENWLAEGASLVSHEEAEMIRPSEQGIQSSVASDLGLEI